MSETNTVVITGGTSGIGRATALRLARGGARVYVSGRDRTRGEQVVKEAAEQGLELRFVAADASRPEDVARLFTTVASEVEGVDAVIVSHGTLGNPAPVQQQTLEDFRGAVEVNLIGSFLVAKQALDHLRDGGAIVFVSSTVGSSVWFPGTSAYAATKAALAGLARTLALETASRGIRVNTVVPGGVDTPMFRSTMGATPESAAHIASLHALGRVAEPDEVARVVAFVSSRDASFVTGSQLVADGGMSIA